MTEKNTATQTEHNAETVSNFIRQKIEADAAQHKYDRVGLPPIITRFPPEPNGYLHIGHAKSICINFGLAQTYGGRCNLRFDDTNPEKESTEYVDSIKSTVKWLGFDWTDATGEHLHYASDYFEQLYAFAEKLIEAGHAYIDSQDADTIRAQRGQLHEAGQNSPHRDRPTAESLDLFRRMKAGEFKEGEHVLRAKIDMASSFIAMRDPVIYRIRFVHHHRTGDAWCIYPLYDFTHCISDAIEQVTHSLCTLEFENNRPLYNWVLARLVEVGALAQPLPEQTEFARLNLTYAITSKRKLLQLVEENLVDGWDDPRMMTLVGIRRRGFTPESIRLFCERIGVSKADSWIDMSVLEQAVRDDLDEKAPRAVAVLKPLKLILDNYPVDHAEPCKAPVHPHHPEMGERHFELTRELWIDQDDFMAEPVKGFFRLFVGNKVRLRYGFVIECTGFDTDEHGNVTAVHANYFADSKSGTEGSNNYKVKGNIHWLSDVSAVPAEIRVYDRLFNDAHPDAGGKDFLQALNPDSKHITQGMVEQSIANVAAETHFQFERHGYFVTDKVDSKAGALVFNRIVGLKDTWQKR
ncbi:Glutamine--tRNA ligase [Ephemeroptericola cinctiostellae]|uniref:Glutamine--tRNA ligase n=1 Tax=Ephemeroptericola cinctiostellae TaxID=2268024 RepID=A0A345DED9_9BURK|nr:glutamine--tRNA ligase/YqeY domain fusion protein [Ephemeroptericola cinctiostellae]AXF86727.1 Glutamine--tRNA ligase [Ephemeroptericola cinctiostellae]